MAAIPITDTVRVRRQVRKATEAACRSTYKPGGGRLYELVYPDSEARQTDWASWRAAREDRQLRELETFSDDSPVAAR